MYRLKPLAWFEIVTHMDYPETRWWSATTVFGSIDVSGSEDDGFTWRYCFDEFYDEAIETCESIADGKARAEVFYLVRIGPALEPVPTEGEK